MKNLRARITAMEERRRGKGPSEEQMELFSRMREDLYKAMLTEARIAPFSTFGNSFANEEGRSFENLVCALHGRISAGTPTDADHRTLESIQEDDLAKTGITAVNFVAMFHHFFNSI